MTPFPLLGLHHVSALSAHIGRTHEFYPGVLGLRPLIKTVNQDEPSMYHLFYGDGPGRPGSDITLFDLPHAVREVRGNNSISCTTFRLHGEESFRYWASRLEELGVPHGDIAERDERMVLDFKDPEGIRLSLVEDEGVLDASPWNESPVPPEHQLRGLGCVELTVPELAPTDAFLTTALGLYHDHSYVPTGRSDVEVHVYTNGEGGAHAEIHVAVRGELPRARYGAGGVHHLALRSPFEGVRMSEWDRRLTELGYRTSGVVDRHYFTSLYVREPGGVLFELATDGPGFAADGPLDAEKLSLPPFLEPRRSEIEGKLKPIEAASR